jgi:hypothetical protein
MPTPQVTRKVQDIWHRPPAAGSLGNLPVRTWTQKIGTVRSGSGQSLAPTRTRRPGRRQSAATGARPSTAGTTPGHYRGRTARRWLGEGPGPRRRRTRWTARLGRCLVDQRAHRRVPRRSPSAGARGPAISRPPGRFLTGFHRRPVRGAWPGGWRLARGCRRSASCTSVGACPGCYQGSKCRRCRPRTAVPGRRRSH